MRSHPPSSRSARPSHPTPSRAGGGGGASSRVERTAGGGPAGGGGRESERVGEGEGGRRNAAARGEGGLEAHRHARGPTHAAAARSEHTRGELEDRRGGARSVFQVHPRDTPCAAEFVHSYWTKVD